jgi:hypothetical protein
MVVRVLLGQSLVDKLQSLLQVAGFNGVPDRKILRVSNVLHSECAADMRTGITDNASEVSNGSVRLS